MEWHRLHPITILKELGALAWAIVGALIFDFEMPAMPGNVTEPDTFIAGAVFAYAVARYLFTSYQLTDRTLQLRRGVFVKKLQTMPRDRIQSVGVNTGLLGRFLGISSVEVSAADTEDISLSYVSHADAARLRRLLEPSRAGAEAGDAVADSPAVAVLGTLPPGALLVFGLTQTAFLVVALALLVVGGVAAFATEAPFAPLGVLPLAAFPVLRVLSLVGFRSWIEEDRLRVVRGLLNRQETDAPLSRIQVVHIGRPPLRRWFGYETVDMATGDVSVSNEDALQPGIVAPLAEIGGWRRVAEQLIGAVALAETDLRRSSILVVRRTMVRGLAATVVVTALVAVPVLVLDLWSVVLVVAAAVGAGLSVVYARARYRILGWAADADHLLVRRGVVSRSLSVVPIPKVQDVAVRATFFQRRLGIASVIVDTAGVSLAGQLKAVDLEADDARRLADHLVHTAAHIALPDGV